MATPENNGSRSRHPKRLSDGRFVITYSCMCHAYVRMGMIKPATSELIWCTKHRRGVSVYSVVGSWWYKCLTCHYSRDYGIAPVTAGVKATKHAAKYPGHDVAVYCGDERQEERKFTAIYPGDLLTQPLPVQLALPFEDPGDPPPF